MQPKLEQIRTVVVVMMENRSFDHLLGHLSLRQYGNRDVDGLKDDPQWVQNLANEYNGAKFPLWHSADPFSSLKADPPHERPNIALQLGRQKDGTFYLDGFVANYASVAQVTAGDHPPVMSYFGKQEVPVSNFLAEKFAVCDRWFSSLPAGTQPNRLMAMSGYSDIELNSSMLLPDQHLLYDWLTDHGVSWRVYHAGMPFFAMMDRWIVPILNDDDRFRRFDRLDDDLMEFLPNELPRVIFVEPSYTDAPHVGVSTDDHAPTGAKAGQEFLLQVYKAFATLNPDLWKNCVMIITYDEHGGFFDHVQPEKIPTNPPAGIKYAPFDSTGVRVPAIIVSPYVTPGQPFHGLLDHTSILKFMGQLFNGGSYSPEVDSRPVGSVYDVLNSGGSSSAAPAPPNLVAYLKRAVQSVGYTPDKSPYNENARSFKLALDKMDSHSRAKTAAKFGDEVTPFLS